MSVFAKELEGEAIPIIKEAMDQVDPNLQLDASIVDVTLNNDELVRAVSLGLKAIRFLIAPHTNSLALYEMSTKAFSESIAEEIVRVQARQRAVSAEQMVSSAFARVKQALIARSDAVVNTQVKYNKFSDDYSISNLEVQRELHSTSRRVPRSVDLLRSRLETPRSSLNERQTRKETSFNSAGETFRVLKKESHLLNRPASGSSFRRGEQRLSDAYELELASSSARSLLQRLHSLDQH